jgi:hypothetical protein
MGESKRKPLADDETYLTRYSKLSGKRKAEIAAAEREELSKAEKQRKRPLMDRAATALGEANPFTPQNIKRENREMAEKDAARREEQYQRALQKSRMTPEERDKKGFFSDDTPRKFDPDERLFNKGGSVCSKKMAKGGSVCRGGGAATKGVKFKGVM